MLENSVSQYPKYEGRFLQVQICYVILDECHWVQNFEFWCPRMVRMTKNHYDAKKSTKVSKISQDVILLSFVASQESYITGR